MIRTRIIGTGSYLPKRVLTNKDLENMVDTSDEWIVSRTGISERRIAEDGEATSDMGTQAAWKALEMAGICPEDLDMIIVSTVSPDMFFPSSACFIQSNLRARKAYAFDLSAACSGFIYALEVADALIKRKGYKYALVVGSEKLSMHVDWKDRNTCIIFADGAGAVVLSPMEGDRGIISTHLHSDGSLGNLLYVPAGGSRRPASAATLEENLHCIKMQGNETFKIAVRSLEEVVIEALKFNNISPSEIDLMIPHQANLRIIEAIAKRLKVPMEKVYVNIHKYGNTSAASIPIALDEANREGRIKEGDLILMNAFGGGMTWSACLARW